MKDFFLYHFNIEGHALMFEDEGRVLSFQKAIENVIRQGDTIADIGTGTGILAFLCLRAGAKRVYAIEDGSVIHLAKILAETNHLSEKISFLEDSSFKVNMPERVDGIITETIGSFGLEEGIIKILYDAKKRFLKEGGWIIPKKLRLFLAPSELSKSCRKNIFIWTKGAYGFDFTPAMKWALNSYYYIKDIKEGHLLGEPQVIHEADLQDPQRFGMRRFPLSFLITREGMLHGFVGWLEVILSPNVSISTAPYKGDAHYHWYKPFFPISPIHVEPGDKVEVELLFSDKGVAGPFFWGGTVISPQGRTKSTFSHMSVYTRQEDDE